MKPLGVRLKLTLWFVGVLLVVLAVNTAWTAALLWRDFGEALEHHLDEDYQVAVQMLERRDAGVAWRGNPDADPGYQGGVRRWVEVWSPDGRQLFRRGAPDAAALQDALLPPTPQGAAHVVLSPAGRLRVISRAFDLDGMPVVVRVARTERSEWEDLKPTVVALLLGIPLALVVAGIGGYILARRVLAPLGEMADRARHISAEQLSARLPVLNPHDELGQLATVFNNLFSRLERSFESLRRFTADASHELRTPLTALRSVGEVGLSELRSSQEYQDIVGSMLEESAKLARLVDGLLLLSRGDGGQTRLTLQVVNLPDKVRDVVAQLLVLAEEKGQVVEVEAIPELPVAIDTGVCRHALVNLLDNAIKYSPEGTRIRISVRRAGRQAVVEVADEGPGIPAAHRDRVFERFYRVERHQDDAVTGSGLGLSIARWAVELHGGQLTLVPDVPRGACFRMTLPLAE